MNDDVNFQANILRLPWFRIQFLIRPGDTPIRIYQTVVLLSKTSNSEI